MGVEEAAASVKARAVSGDGRSGGTRGRARRPLDSATWKSLVTRQGSGKVGRGPANGRGRGTAGWRGAEVRTLMIHLTYTVVFL